MKHGKLHSRIKVPGGKYILLLIQQYFSQYLANKVKNMNETILSSICHVFLRLEIPGHKATVLFGQSFI